MDEGLFGKYAKTVQIRKAYKQDILLCIQEKTGLVLQEKNIEVKNKEIKLVVSSLERSILHRKNIKEILKKKGEPSNQKY